MPAQGGGALLGRVHLITDSSPGADPVDQVRAVLKVATPLLTVQFRPADDWTDRQVFRQAVEIIALARPLGVRVLINDRVDIALAADADGAHVGADDLPVAAARRILGGTRILGATARDALGTRAAVGDGADYVGVGPCYVTSTKPGLPEPLGPQGVQRAAPYASVIAVGGVTVEKVPELLAAGAHGVAVIGAVAGAPDPAAALARLLEAVAR
jgi:thiamine-phosphate pyrophosphorylase